MQEIGQVMSTLPMSEEHRQKGRERIKEILKDQDVVEFVAAHRLDKEKIKESLSRLNEFYMAKKQGHSKPPELRYNDGQVQVYYPPVEFTPRQRMGINTSLVLDKVTEALPIFTLDQLHVNPEAEDILKAFKRLVRNYEFMGEQSGVWLYGDFGLGKSYLMAGVARSLNEKGAGVVYITTSSLLEDLKNMFGTDERGHIRRITQLKNAEVLILDDIGTESTGEWGYKTILYEILNYRANNNRLTFFTSNLTQEEFAAQVERRLKSRLDAGRMLERIQVLSKQVLMTGPNMRKKA